MKNFLLLLTLFASSASFAVSTKKCPDTFKLEISRFKAEVEPGRDDHNPQLPFAYINVANMKSRSVVMNKKTAANATCTYSNDDSENYYYAKLDGSLREGSANPATLTVYFTEMYQGMHLDYVVYAPVKDMTKDKVLVLDGKSSLYYAGEHCSWGDCIPDHIRLGSAYAEVQFTDGGACVSMKEAKEKMADHLDAKENYRSKTIDRLVNSMRFQTTENEFWAPEDGYYTEVAESWTCAPSVECWFGFYVNCAGEVKQWSGGED